MKARADGGLMADIRSHVIKEADKPTDRRQDVIHPSEMSNHHWCPRATYYRIRDVRNGVELKPEQFAIGTLSIFEEGHYIHDKYQTWLREMGRLKGRWDCRECKSRGVAWPDDPGQCPLCDSITGIKYGEVPLDAIKEHLISGHADGWVDTGLIEIKSIGKGTVRLDAPKLYREYTVETYGGKTVVDIDGMWEAITRPLPAHVKQANIYLYIAKLMGIPVDYMEFLYEFKANQQTKSFTVKLSPTVIDPLIEKADTIKNGLETNTPPPREFEKPDKKPCSGCPWLKECYQVDDTDAIALKDGVSKKDTLQARARVQGRNVLSGKRRVARVPRMQSESEAEEGQAASRTLQERSRENTRERAIRRTRSSSSMPTVRKRAGREVACEESGVRKSVEIPKSVRNNARRVRRDVAQPGRSMQDLPD